MLTVDTARIHKERHVGDRAANEEAENAVKEIRRQVRVLKSRLEEKLLRHVPKSILFSRGCRNTEQHA